MQRKSTDHKIKAGTLRPSREKPAPITGTLKALPDPPFEMTGEALEIYTQEGTQLIEQGTLKTTDVRLLAAYATEISTYTELMQHVAQEGAIIELPNGILTSSAHRKAAESALKNASALADKLGISPIGRARLGLKVEPGNQEPEDPLAIFLN